MSNQIYSDEGLLFDLPWGQRTSPAGTDLGTNYKYKINNNADATSSIDNTASMFTAGGLAVSRALYANSISSDLSITGTSLTVGTARVTSGMRCSAYQSALSAQLIPTGSPTPITMNAELYDIGGMHSTVITTSRFTNTSTSSKYFQINYTLGFQSIFAGDRQAYILIGGDTTHKYGWTRVNTAASIGSVLCGSCEIFLISGNYIELWAYQASGSDQSTGNDSSDYCSLQIQEIY